MGRLKLYKDSYTDTTVISNTFIDNYMAEANDAQIKVYLYLIRMMSDGLVTSISDIADKFNYTERDILRSLKYWEKQQLLSLEYDENRNLSGVRISEPETKKDTIISEPAAPKVESPSVDSQNTFKAEIVPLAKKNTKVNPKDFLNDNVFSEILFIAEQYLGKMLSATETQSLLFIYDSLGFSRDLMDFLIEYCVENNHKSMRYIETVARNWAAEGITNIHQAKLHAHKYDKLNYTIMKALGKSSTPTSTETGFISKWTKDMGFSLEMILIACDKTVLAVDKNRFQYTDGILNNWSKAGISTKEQAMTLERAPVNRAPKTSGSQFRDFKQNSYDFSSLEKEILSN